MSRRFPFATLPRGWFSLGLASDIAPGQVRALHRFGRELALFRTETGRLALLDGHCPHLGAHLGHGSVRGEEIVCPFHALSFDGTGKCGALPAAYEGRAPLRLAARCWDVREVDGFILAWFHPEGAPPDFQPEPRFDSSWRAIRSHAWGVRTHPQESGEGSVDLTHLMRVHGYVSAESLAPPRVDPHRFAVDYRIVRKTEWGMRGESFAMTLGIELTGLGFSTVLVQIPDFELAYRIWVLATPIDDDAIDYRVAFSMAPMTRPSRLHAALALFPKSIAAALVERMTWRAFVHDVELDFPIWENKAYLDRPVLLAGDGPVGRYRKWARHFYGGGDAEDRDADDAESRASPDLRTNHAGSTTASAPSPPPTADASTSPALGPTAGISPSR
jgi:nitrite reductase/ring-hydroxylating ferredoxin subunit